jgi:predicted transcriptional regulator
MPYIPDSVFEGGAWETLTAVEAKVYVTLCQHYNRKERIAFPSMLRISKICGCSKRHVVRVIELLCQKGLIVKRKKDNPYGRSFNYYKLPDFMLYELEQLQENPAKNAGDIMSLAGDIMSLLGDIRGKRQVPTSHPNYIINHITNIVNSFNSKEPKTIGSVSIDDPQKYREILAQRLPEYWQENDLQKRESARF